MNANNESPDDVCVRCRKGRVSPVSVDAVHNHDGVSVSFKDEFMRCDSCGREFYTTEQSMARSRAITAGLRKAQGFMDGDEIRRIRRSYGLKLPEFEQALGVGKNTVGRWERNTVPPTGAANFGLFVAAKYPAVFEDWAGERGITVRARPRLTVTAVSQTVAAPTSQFRGRLAKEKISWLLNVGADRAPWQETSEPIAAAGGLSS
jgi:putative zinc finger/helix-turn-helix YgiT family protein